MREFMCFILIFAMACGSGDDSCSSIAVIGNNSQASCGSENDQNNINSVANDVPIEIDQFCEDYCLNRGNPLEGLREGDCYKECVLNRGIV